MDPEEEDSDNGDSGGLEVFDAEIMQYLEGVLGENDFDADFLDEFRNSDLFQDVMRECGVQRGAGSTDPANSSRRPSLNESDRGAQQDHPDPPQEQISSRPAAAVPEQPELTESRATPEPEPNILPSSSSSKQRKSGPFLKKSNTKSKKTVMQAPRKGNYKSPAFILDSSSSSSSSRSKSGSSSSSSGSSSSDSSSSSSSSSNSDSEEDRSHLQKKKLSDKLKIRPKTVSPPKKSTSFNKGQETEEQQKKLEKRAGPKPKHQPEPASSYKSEAKPKNPRCGFVSRKSTGGKGLKQLDSPDDNVTASGTRAPHIKSSSSSDVPQATLHLMDCLKRRNLFPNGISGTVQITPRLLDELIQCEMQLRLECSSCSNHRTKRLSRPILCGVRKNTPSTSSAVKTHAKVDQVAEKPAEKDEDVSQPDPKPRQIASMPETKLETESHAVKPKSSVKDIAKDTEEATVSTKAKMGTEGESCLPKEDYEGPKGLKDDGPSQKVSQTTAPISPKKTPVETPTPVKESPPPVVEVVKKKSGPMSSLDRLTILNERLNKEKARKANISAEKIKTVSTDGKTDSSSCSKDKPKEKDPPPVAPDLEEIKEEAGDKEKARSISPVNRAKSPSLPPGETSSTPALIKEIEDTPPVIPSSEQIVEESPKATETEDVDTCTTQQKPDEELPTNVVQEDKTEKSEAPQSHPAEAESVDAPEKPAEITEAQKGDDEGTGITVTQKGEIPGKDSPDVEVVEDIPSESVKESQNKDVEEEEKKKEVKEEEKICDIDGGGATVEEKQVTFTSEVAVVEDEDVVDAGPPSPANDDMGSPASSPVPDDSRYSSSPEIIGRRKSPTPERASSKKKKFIESSSDDGDQNTPERKKSSDDEPGVKKGVRFAHNPSIERKRDQEDSRSGKFDGLALERQRKRDKKKGGRDRPGKSDPLEDFDFFKETQLGSFRIPKRSTNAPNKRPDVRTIVTPLTSVDVPKENMQFERFRKGLSDKDKIEKKERGEWRDRGTGGGDNKFGSNARANREPTLFEKHKLRDEERVVLLAPELRKRHQEPAAPEPEALWGDDGDGEEPAGGVSPDMGVDGSPDLGGDDSGGDAANDTQPADDNAATAEGDKEDEAGKEDKEKTEAADKTVEKEGESTSTTEVTKEDSDNDDLRNPEIPLKEVTENAFSVGTLLYLQQTPDPELPDIEVETNLAESTMIKMAWWIYYAKFELSKDPGSREDWWEFEDGQGDGDEDNEGANSDTGSYLDRLNFSQVEENEIFNSLSREEQRKRNLGPVDELCGRTLLVSQYRSGPGDTFSNIFQLRGENNIKVYFKLKDKFQARCTLCDQLVVGAQKLADHVSSYQHKEKMSKAGLDNIKPAEGAGAADKDKQTEKDKKPSNDADKNGSDSKKDGRSKSPDKKDRKKEDGKKDKKDEDKRKDKSDKKRKRSKDGSCSEKDSGAEIGVTSTGAIPVKNSKKERSDSKDKRSRSGSRSPRHKRNRSRSPRHHSDRRDRRRSRSRSPYSGRRRRSRSRERERERIAPPRGEPVVRISRSPSKLRRRSRSTSAERVQKFLAKTQRRSRSRSPSNGYRKRHRPASPQTSSGLMPKKTNKEFHEKMALTVEGKWTEDLETKWKLMEMQEAMFMEQFGEKSKALKKTPENHPNYSEEWTAFWERRYQEIERERKEDPDKHDYVPEWKEYWTKKLNELLENEYEEGIKRIKVQHGVDIETLQQIRHTPTQPVLPGSSQMPPQPVPPPMMPIPQPVPPPVSLPVRMVPQPHVIAPRAPSIPSIQGTITPSSGSVSDMGDDMIARSMSISDGGDDYPDPNRNKAVPAVTTVDIMSTWEKLKSGGLPQNKATPPPSVQSLPRAPVSIARSDDTSSFVDSDASIASYPFNTGMDVVQILRYISKLDDQLSFFQNKVDEYYKKAEELDLKKSNHSLLLLKDEDFVVMLFQIRDRFMALIRACVAPKDVLQKLNFSVYALNDVLEHPDCIKRRPRPSDAPVIMPEPKKPEEPQPPPVPTASTSANDTFTRPAPKVAAPNAPTRSYQSLFRKVPDTKKRQIAGILAGYLLSMGREDLNERELREFMNRVMSTPPTSPSVGGSPSSACGSAWNASPNPPTARGYPGSGGGGGYPSSSPNMGRNVGDSPHMDPWRQQNRTLVHSVASSQQRSCLPIPELPNVLQYPHNNPLRAGPGTMGYGNPNTEPINAPPPGGWGRGQGPPRPGMERDGRMSSGSSGRNSPFSMRDFTGNPRYDNPFRDKDPGSASNSNSQNRRAFKPSGNAEKRDSNVVTVGTVVTVNTESKLMRVRPNPRQDDEVEITMCRVAQSTNRRPSAELYSASLKVEPEEQEPGLGSVEQEIAYHFQREEKKRLGVSSRSASTDEEENEVAAAEDDLAHLPPGVRAFVLKERQRKMAESKEVGEVVSEEEAQTYYRRRKKKRKRKRGRAKENRNSSGDSSEEENSDVARDRSKERRKRRERKRKKKDKQSSEESSPNRESERRQSRTRRERSKSPEEVERSRRSKERVRSKNRRRSRSESVSSGMEREERRSRRTRTRSRHDSREDYRSRRGRSESASSREGRRQRRSESRRDYGSRHGRSKSASSTEDRREVRRYSKLDPRRRSLSVSPDRYGDRNYGRYYNEQSEGTPRFERERDSVPRRSAPHRADYSDSGEISEYSVSPPPQPQPHSSRHLLRENNLSVITRPPRGITRFDMFAPSPPVSEQSGGSGGYRRTKQRPSRTTVRVPNKTTTQAPLVIENWENSSLSEVSNVGEDKTSKPSSTSSAPKPPPQKNPGTKEKVTSISKSFWTEKDDAMSVSDVSSHEPTPQKNPSAAPVALATETVSEEEEAKRPEVPVVTENVPAPEKAPTTTKPPLVHVDKNSRNYRKSVDEDKEPGELSSSSAELDEV